MLLFFPNFGILWLKYPIAILTNLFLISLVPLVGVAGVHLLAGVALLNYNNILGRGLALESIVVWVLDRSKASRRTSDKRWCLNLSRNAVIAAALRRERLLVLRGWSFVFCFHLFKFTVGNYLSIWQIIKLFWPRTPRILPFGLHLRTRSWGKRYPWRC